MFKAYIPGNLIFDWKEVHLMSTYHAYDSCTRVVFFTFFFLEGSVLNSEIFGSDIVSWS